MTTTRTTVNPALIGRRAAEILEQMQAHPQWDRPARQGGDELVDAGRAHPGGDHVVAAPMQDCSRIAEPPAQ
uniref:hypothetical protein n=1 Tax=Paractinoplanes polyasparticus TaxID=2856853 RepID=UPI001C862916|nr:hypothetical protein [Actinoplanes polyasparticus]